MLKKTNVFYPGHIPTNILQKVILSIGGSVACILDPTRDDLVATLGETMGISSLRYIRDKMLSTEEGREILNKKPVINSKTVDFKALEQLPLGTLGKSYADWYKINNVSPDTRKPVHFVDDKELRYVIQRYREIHDLSHTLLDMPTNILGEVCVKWVEAIQTGLPMCFLAALFGPLRFTKKQNTDYINSYLKWAVSCGYNAKFLLSIYYEKYWDKDIKLLRRELNILEAPSNSKF